MSEPDEYWTTPTDDKVDELESRIEELERNLVIAATNLDEYFDVIIGLIVGLMEAAFVKAMSESDKSREEFSQILENAIREDIVREYPSKEQRHWARRVMRKLAGLVSQPSGDRILKLYSPPLEGRDQGKLSSGD